MKEVANTCDREAVGKTSMLYWTCSTDGESAARVWTSCDENGDDDDVIMALLAISAS